MNKSSIFFTSGALVLSLSGALLVKSITTPEPPRIEPKDPVVTPAPTPVFSPILTAAHSLKPGDFLDGGSIQWVEADKDYSELIYLKRNSIEKESVFGTTVREPIEKGAPLTYNLLVQSGEPGFLATVLREGMRAVAIPTSAVASNAGLVSPGDYVDVILSVQDTSNSASSEDKEAMLLPKIGSQTLLNNVRVLALNNETTNGILLRRELTTSSRTSKKDKSAPQKYYDTATLEVSPQNAERLSAAQLLGTLHLSLRRVSRISEVLTEKTSSDNKETVLTLSTSSTPQTDETPSVSTLEEVTDIYGTFKETVPNSDVVNFFASDQSPEQRSF